MFFLHDDLLPCGASVAPACAYCAKGRMTADEAAVLCPKKGVVKPTDRCRGYVYDPLLRKPNRQPQMPDFDPQEFSLTDTAAE